MKRSRLHYLDFYLLSLSEIMWFFWLSFFTPQTMLIMFHLCASANAFSVVVLPLLLLQLLSVVLHLPLAKATSGLRVPTFMQEPGSRLLFSNDTGTQVSCTAHGTPTPIVTWVLKDGTMATQVPGLRWVAATTYVFYLSVKVILMPSFLFAEKL